MRTFKQEEELADLILTRCVKNRAPFSSSSRFKAGNEFPAIIASEFLPSIVEQGKKKLWNGNSNKEFRQNDQWTIKQLQESIGDISICEMVSVSILNRNAYEKANRTES